MSFRDNLMNGFRKITTSLTNWYARFTAKRAREKEIRDAARVAAEPIYWKERERVIIEQEKERAKQRARPIKAPSLSPITSHPQQRDFSFGGSQKESPINISNGMNGFDFLGTKNKTKVKKMKDIKWY